MEVDETVGIYGGISGCLVDLWWNFWVTLVVLLDGKSFLVVFWMAIS
jgi:hypothetical protein